MTHEDVQWLQSLKNGSEYAFKEIYKKHKEDVYYSSYEILRNRQDAEDVLQRVFKKFWKDREVIIVNSSLKAYLSKMAYNLSINEKNGKTRRDKKKGEYFESVELMEEHPEIQEEDERLTAIKEALKDLPLKNRRLFEAISFHGVSHKEFAEKAGLSIYTVRIQLYKIREMLRSKFGQK